MDYRALLLDSYRAALAAVDSLNIVVEHLPRPPRGRTLVVGAGKAAASMAAAVEKHWPASAPLSGLVVTRYRHSLPTQRIQVIEAGHPVPDKRGEEAARSILTQVQSLAADDLLLCLVSGGGSSLLSLPAEGIGMADLKAVTKELLRCGAAIGEINTVRKHLSAVQGGRLAAACKAPVVALIISDVTGDDPTNIASGPCAPDPTTYADALSILKRYGIKPPQAVSKRLKDGHAEKVPETPKPGDPVFRKTRNLVIATGYDALQAAAEFFERKSIRPVILGDSVTGEAREVAKVYAALAREIRAHQQPWHAPVALISGGETTVTVRGKGRGGRNSEFLLSLAVELNGMENVYALAADTDGIDGSEDNAGALLFPDSLKRAGQMKLNAEKMLWNNDGYSFFKKLGDLVVTGPTLTNVNDYRVILVS
jgi:hydroxypyruvate reductase